MKTKTLSQFLRDYFKDSDQILVNAKWLQSNIIEAVNTERTMKNKISELQSQVDRFSIKIDSLKAERMVAHFESSEVYKLDIKA